MLTSLLPSLLSGQISFGSFCIYLIIIILGVLLSLSFHEWAHAFSAYKLGDPTAKNMGRMTLDPLRHVDPIGAILLLFVGFGWAKPVPVNPGNFKRRQRDDNIVSLAGVFTNFILAFLFAGLYVLFAVILKYNLFDIMSLNFTNAGTVLGAFLFFSMSLNIGLGLFNLIPIPPLDGYHILRNALIGRVQPQKLWNFERYARYGFLALLVLSMLLNYISNISLFGYLSIAVNWIMNGFIKFWLLFV